MLDRQGLKGEAHVHHRGRVALGGGEVDHAAAGQQVQRRPPRSNSSTSGRTCRAGRSASALRPAMSISTSKWPALASMAPSFIRSKCSARRTELRAGHGHEEVAALGGVEDRHHLEAVHARLERAEGVDLAHDHRGARAAGALGDALAREAVAQQDERVAGEQDVGGAQDAVDRRLAGAVAVVEGALGAGLVEGEDRVAQAALLGQVAQADDAGGGLLGAAQAGAGPRR